MNQNCCLEMWGGMECTVNRVGNRYADQRTLGAVSFSRDRLEKIVQLGIRTIRYPLLWEEVAPERAHQKDWSLVETELELIKEFGIRPIAGLLHHGSGPKYTDLLDRNFPFLFAEYARSAAQRFPWIEDWTPINEPLTTARFSCLYGHWFPHRRDPLDFCKALLHQIQAIGMAMREIRRVVPRARLVQTEDLGKTSSSRGLEYQASFENERRWLTYDLLTGGLDRESPSYKYMRTAGISESEIASAEETAYSPDIIGINHYITSNRHLDGNIEYYPATCVGGNGRERYADVEAVRVLNEGLCAPRDLLREAWSRYGMPLAITEAHLGCTREEQMRWLYEIWQSARELREEGVPVVAVTAWSLYGAFDWDSLLTNFRGSYEPGAFDLRSAPPRPTAVAGLIAELTRTGVSQDPLVSLPGWWQRTLRLLPHKRPDPIFKRSMNAFTPLIKGRNQKPCRPLLIAGGNGRLARAFARICFLRGIPYRVLSRQQMDICQAAAVRRVLDELKPWAVVNAAGYSHVDHAEKEPERCYRENVTGVQVVAHECAGRGVKLVAFSSDQVFDGEKAEPYLEDDTTSSLSVFGRSKAESEKCALGLNNKTLVIRAGGAFSAWDEANFVARTARELALKKPVEVADDLSVSPTYLPDLVQACLDLLIDGETGIWHLSNKGSATWSELACAIAEFTKTDPALIISRPHSELGFTARRPKNASLGTIRGALLEDWAPSLLRCVEEIQKGDPVPYWAATA